MHYENNAIELFVPGRLCLMGEHSDWAGMYRMINSGIAKGMAVVSGIEQGIYAIAEKADKFIMAASGDISDEECWECEMDSQKLIQVAQEGGFFSYAAGVASYINDNYNISGVKITITKRDLPIKRGLSSSAAICVLVARAFNQLYNLKMNISGEMQAAYRGEQRTPSRCGRLDQACAYGVKPVYMEFDGNEVYSRSLRAGGTFHWVIANLMASKDTIKILADLNKSYPFAHNETEKQVQEALGADNRLIVEKAVRLIEDGDAVGLGALMQEAQANFDKKVMPASSELIAPVLHSVLNDPVIKQFIYGAKGVGSNGDGSVQFLAKSSEDADKLQKYLTNERGMESFRLTIKPEQAVKKAVIPLAGFGTRVFPATKCMKKCFMPVLDADGLLKPALLILLERLLESNIEDICLIIGDDDQEEFDNFFAPLPEEFLEQLPEDKLKYDRLISKMRKNITYVHQKERLGFGHAVWQARKFTNDEPALLLLGDFLYRSNTSESCCKQIIDAYSKCGKPLVSIMEVPLERVVHYGILHGIWEDQEETVMKVDTMVEKPTTDYASEYLGVEDSHHRKKYYATFGQYVLTREVFEELEHEICQESEPSEGKEYGLTAALDKVCRKHGMYAFVPDGRSFDIGLPETYRMTMMEYCNDKE